MFRQYLTPCTKNMLKTTFFLSKKIHTTINFFKKCSFQGKASFIGRRIFVAACRLAHKLVSAKKQIDRQRTPPAPVTRFRNLMITVRLEHCVVLNKVLSQI